MHFFLGILLEFILTPLLYEELPFLFPYITGDFIIIVEIIGWISFISGIALILSSFFSKFFFKKKLLRLLIIIPSIFLLIIYPIGTWYGLILIIENSSVKNKKKNINWNK